MRKCKTQSLEHLQALLSEHKDVRTVASILGIGVHGVYYHMAKHGLSARNAHWTTQMDNYIIFYAYHKSHKAIARKLGVTIAALNNRIVKLGLTMRNCIGYTSRDFAHDCGGMSMQLISQMWLRRGLPYRKVGGVHVVLDHDRVYDWLAAGNVFRLHDISKCAPYIQEIYAQCEHTYIRTDEILQIAAFRHDQVWQPPSPVLQVDTGYVYIRKEFSEWLAWNSHLIYAGARGEYIESIRDEARERYITSTQLKAFRENIIGLIWHNQRRGFPAPIRTRPNVWERGPVLEWLRSHSTDRTWGQLYQYLVRMS